MSGYVKLFAKYPRTYPRPYPIGYWGHMSCQKFYALTPDRILPAKYFLSTISLRQASRTIS